MTLNQQCLQSLMEDAARCATQQEYTDIFAKDHPLRAELDQLSEEEIAHVAMFVHGATVGSSRCIQLAGLPNPYGIRHDLLETGEPGPFDALAERLGILSDHLVNHLRGIQRLRAWDRATALGFLAGLAIPVALHILAAVIGSNLPPSRP